MYNTLTGKEVEGGCSLPPQGGIEGVKPPFKQFGLVLFLFPENLTFKVKITHQQNWATLHIMVGCLQCASAADLGYSYMFQFLVISVLQVT